MLEAALQEALAPVLADIRATGAPEPRVGPITEDMLRPAFRDHAFPENDLPEPDLWGFTLWSADGGRTGVFLTHDSAPMWQLLDVTDRVQEWVIEELWGRHSNWPPCPQHPSSHPMQAVEHEGQAWWACP